MDELEWRSFGIRQSPGWVHYMIHSKTQSTLITLLLDPEPHILMFRREKNYQV